MQPQHYHIIVSFLFLIQHQKINQIKVPMRKAKTRLRQKGYRMIDRICDDRKMTFSVLWMPKVQMVVVVVCIT